MAFADVLKDLMDDRGLSQSELARRVGVSSQAVNQWTGGDAVPKGSRLQAIADALGVAPSLLMPFETVVSDVEVRERLRLAMQAKGFGEKQLAEAAGASSNHIRSLVSGAVAGADLRRRVARLASALGTTPMYLAYGDSPPEKVEAPTGGRFAFQSAETAPRDLPVWGVAQGGEEGAMSVQIGTTDLAVDWIIRPKVVAHVKDAFSFYVIGSSMEPRWFPGELVVVNPTRPARPGDPVLVILNGLDQATGGKRALFKRLVRRSPSKLDLHQTNPDKDMTIAADQVEHLWRVYEWGELFSGL